MNSELGRCSWWWLATLGEWVSGQDVAKVPVQKQLVITVALLPRQALTVCSQTAVKPGDNLCTSQNMSHLTNARGRNWNKNAKNPADGIAGSAAFMSHYQCLYIHNKTCRTITLKDTVPAVFNAVFFYMLHATCFPLGTGLFQSKLEICISLSVGLDIFLYSTAKCLRWPPNRWNHRRPESDILSGREFVIT